MKKPLRVLIVEDSEDDTLLVVRELKHGGFEPVFERVESVDGMSAALKEKKWDLVISDHSMPGFESFKALEVLKQKELDIPFILVSGSIGEDLAVQAMKAGASDYMMKGRLNRLVPSIERELREAHSRNARRTAEAALRHSQQELADFFDHAPVGCHWAGPDGVILQANEAELNLLGYSREEYLGHSISEFHVDQSKADDILNRLRKGETVDNYEAQLRRKDGSVREVMINVNALWRHGKFIHSRCFTRDVTQLKQEEEERVKLIAELTEALGKIKTLRGLLPICASCKKIRDDHGYWQKVESFVAEHTEAEFTHGICPDCLKRLYPEYVRRG